MDGFFTLNRYGENHWPLNVNFALL